MSEALYPRFDAPDYPAFERQIRAFWEAQDVFTLSVANRSDAQAFTFYEGPPSANGSPGIHHVMARTIKDLVCRYKTLAGYQVERKAGWDTHGLPVELQVEKALGITKKDIGDGPEHTISLADYNQKCREDVLKYKDQWDELTKLMGYWVNLDDPYITYEREYIESVWHLLKRLYDKDLLYKGYTIQPYSPAAGTGLSSHELNQPGCYRDVKDTSVTALFKAMGEDDLYFIAWTTTPWTLSSNAALGVGPKIEYSTVRTINPYTEREIRVVVAKDRIPAYFAEPLTNPNDVKEKKRKSLEVNGQTYHFRKSELNAKAPLLALEKTVTGSTLVGTTYEQLMPYVKPEGKAFEVIAGDFVTTEDGTGIVHLAPTFGADDKRVADDAGIVAITVPGEKDDEHLPLVDKQGKFVRQMSEGLFADLKSVVGEGEESIQRMDAYLSQDGGFFVKTEYVDADDYPNMDVEIATLLKKTDRAFKVEKYVHNYPHCWRTDKPVLYYPLDSWFIKTTALKDRLVELNTTINWKPEGTGKGRFGNWLENLTDWNLSRSRFWGTPLPIWVNVDRTEMKCIGSIEELRTAAREALTKKPELLTHYTDRLNQSYPAIKAELPDLTDGNAILEALLEDLHRPFVDEIVLLDSNGNVMRREPDLIDVWFDSGAMPYAQWHYPFKNEDIFKRNFPADFIAEGVDQTRGWFFTLHAIATLLEDSVAYKNVIANGLVQDKDGRKMSKRLGNAVDPFETINTHGADATRWYMVANAPPWENLRFNREHLEETKRKFLGTLYYTYDFFALYANIDGYQYDARKATPIAERTELDRWILSVANSTFGEVRAAFDDYDPTRAARAVQELVTEQLSNWFVRLSRRRFWKGEMNADKQAAYDTLFDCLVLTSQMMAPIAPFLSDWLFRNLTGNLSNIPEALPAHLRQPSVHLTDLAQLEEAAVNEALESRMDMAQRICSLGRSIRRQHKLKVRQPLARVMIPVLSVGISEQIRAVEDIILSELNIKRIQFVGNDDKENVIVKKIKPNFRTLGPKLGADMKAVADVVRDFSQADISELEENGHTELTYGDGKTFSLLLEDVEITSEDIPGWAVASDGKLTVALDLTLTPELEQEGIAREYVNRIQNVRKDEGLAVTDHIHLHIDAPEEWQSALTTFKMYICAEVLADSFELTPNPSGARTQEIDGKSTAIAIQKV